MGPGYLRNGLTPMGLARPTHASRRGMLRAPLATGVQLAGPRRAFSAVTPALWNILSTETRSASIFLIFLPVNHQECITLEVVDRLREDPTSPSAHHS